MAGVGDYFEGAVGEDAEIFGGIAPFDAIVLSSQQKDGSGALFEFWPDIVEG